MGSVSLEGFGGGGGAALNFDVVRYATESELLAATPKENTIGIVSTTEITGWIIDANQPENMTNGMVWISMGTSSVLEFNALKKCGIKIYPISAKQNINGAFVNVPAMIYQDGTWNELHQYYYHPTYGYIGEWKSSAYTESGSSSTPLTANIAHNADNMQIISTGSGTSLIYNDKLTEFSGVTALTAKVRINNPDNMIVRLIITPAIKQGYTTIAEAEIPRSGKEETVEIPLSGASFKGYVAFRYYANSSGMTLTINSVKLEKG